MIKTIGIDPIYTKRLLLRELLDTDIHGMFALDADPRVHRFLGTEVFTEMSQSADVITFIRAQYRDFGVGRLAVTDRYTGEFMGWCGLKYFDTEINGHQGFYELGYRFIPRYWGQGIATEAATATVAYGFEAGNLQEIFAMADCHNIASNRLLLKIGFESLGHFLSGEEKLNWYKITKSADF